MKVEDDVPPEINMGLDRIYGPIGALPSLFTNFWANMDVCHVACKELSVPYEEHGYGYPTGLYISVSV